MLKTFSMHPYATYKIRFGSGFTQVLSPKSTGLWIICWAFMSKFQLFKINYVFRFAGLHGNVIPVPYILVSIRRAFQLLPIVRFAGHCAEHARHLHDWSLLRLLVPQG